MTLFRLPLTPQFSQLLKLVQRLKGWTPKCFFQLMLLSLSLPPLALYYLNL